MLPALFYCSMLQQIDFLASLLFQPIAFFNIYIAFKRSFLPFLAFLFLKAIFYALLALRWLAGFICRVHFGVLHLFSVFSIIQPVIYVLLALLLTGYKNKYIAAFSAVPMLPALFYCSMLQQIGFLASLLFQPIAFF